MDGRVAGAGHRDGVRLAAIGLATQDARLERVSCEVMDARRRFGSGHPRLLENDRFLEGTGRDRRRPMGAVDWL